MRLTGKMDKRTTIMMRITLSEPTVFPDLNSKESKGFDFSRDMLDIEKLKYKHIRSALKFPEIDQMHHLMMMLTGLNENDIGELAPEDAARISFMLHESLMKYNQFNPTLNKM
jgi:hypothetical protein